MAEHRKRLLGASEAAETLLREVLEWAGERGAETLPLAEAERCLEGCWGTFGQGVEQGEAELTANVAVLSRLLGLDPAGRDLLGLFAAIPIYPALQQALERLGVRSRHQAIRTLSVVLGHPMGQVRDALGPDAPLVRYHIVNPTAHTLELTQFCLLDEELERALSSSRTTEAALLDSFFMRSPRAALTEADFSHLEPRLSTLIEFLRGAGNAEARGVNVLFAGLPGTGKTELARLVAETIGWRAFEVRTENYDGSASSGDERMTSYWLAQRFLEGSNDRLLIFDEFEDVFSDEFGGGRAKVGKLFMNRALEGNAVPTIFIVNDIAALSLPLRRRFDFSLLFGPLPGVSRRRVLERHLLSMTIDPTLRDQLLRRELLLPSQVAAACKVARFTKDAEASALLHAIDASMRLLEQPIPRNDDELDFDIALCNADTDLELAIKGLARHDGRGVIALHGPPGVGKSAAASYVARALGLHAVRITASDLLNAFLGETEQRVARLFEGVDANAEALVLEEADEMLAVRDATRSSWEIRLANEVLIRMESFPGLLILTTNAVERFDVAALRRCHLKVRLGYLRFEQRVQMWLRRFGRAPPPEIMQRLAAVDRLTAGDFSAVVMQRQLMGAEWTDRQLLEALEKEIEFRRSSRRVGFV